MQPARASTTTPTLDSRVSGTGIGGRIPTAPRQTRREYYCCIHALETTARKHGAEWPRRLQAVSAVRLRRWRSGPAHDGGELCHDTGTCGVFMA